MTRSLIYFVAVLIFAGFQAWLAWDTHQWRLQVQADCRVFMERYSEDPARCD